MELEELTQKVDSYHKEVKEEVADHRKKLYGNGDAGLCEDNRNNKKKITEINYELDMEIRPTIKDYNMKKIFFQGALWVLGILFTLITVVNTFNAGRSNDAVKQMKVMVEEVQKINNGGGNHR